LKNSQLLDSKQSVPVSLASDLESVRHLFKREADASFNSIEVHDQLQDCIKHGAAEGGDPNLAFNRAHQIVEEGLYEWFGNLQKIAGKFVTNLATIALGHPELNDDPASWARGRTKESLDRWLDGLWSPQIVIWFHDAWGGPYLDCTQYDSWCAPTWVEESRELTTEPASLDERITPERTETLFKYWRRKIDVFLDHGLEQAEHITRVNLALQRVTRVPLKHGPRRNLEAELNPSGVRAQEKVIFVRRTGKIIAEPKFSDIALLNTYESLKDTLTQIRAFIISEKGTSVSEGLKAAFGRTELGKVATDKNWKEWIHIFAEQGAAPGNTALVFLEDATGQNRDTIKNRCSNARRTTLESHGH
jgi:hypothetical protein